uniref:hypothetical protein n=1 Tax=Cryptomonas gyropyrenoidosa TaxID=233257 RepID=UPI0027A9846D|nr:hypothetical protein QLP26_pgp049 [Cryptomonas gyropyrenoidosa]WFQ83033.1 hypothetical protein [Cryptomonas gyropyrenoidosa]
MEQDLNSTSWKTLRWDKFRNNVKYLQKKIHEAHKNKDYTSFKRFQKLLFKSKSLQYLAVHEVTTFYQTVGIFLSEKKKLHYVDRVDFIINNIATFNSDFSCTPHQSFVATFINNLEYEIIFYVLQQGVVFLSKDYVVPKLFLPNQNFFEISLSFLNIDLKNQYKKILLPTSYKYLFWQAFIKVYFSKEAFVFRPFSTKITRTNDYDFLVCKKLICSLVKVFDSNFFVRLNNLYKKISLFFKRKVFFTKNYLKKNIYYLKIWLTKLLGFLPSKQYFPFLTF